MATGRPRKAGAERYQSGRIKPQPKANDNGCEGVRKQRELYIAAIGANNVRKEANLADPVGRAFEADLICDRLAGAARRMQHIYRAAIPSPRSCLQSLHRTPGGGGDDLEEGRNRREVARAKEFKTKSDKIMNQLGRAYWSTFDDVVFPSNPDHGPDWLDRIILANGDSTQVVRYDLQQLERLTAALELIGTAWVGAEE